MAITKERRLTWETVRKFGTGREYQLPKDLTKIQTASYANFLQLDAEPEKRKDHGIEGVLKEIFPIQSYDCLLYTSPSPRDKRQSRMPSSA